MDRLKKAKIPPGAPGIAGRLGALVALGGAGIYALNNCLFNVEGGHRGVVFNRFVGIKEEVRPDPRMVGNGVGRERPSLLPSVLPLLPCHFLARGFLLPCMKPEC